MLRLQKDWDRPIRMNPPRGLVLLSDAIDAQATEYEQHSKIGARHSVKRGKQMSTLGKAL